MQIPSPSTVDGALTRLKRHAAKYTRRGVSEIRANVKANMMFLEVVKEAKSGLVGRVFGVGNVRGVGKMARLEYLGPNKWRLLIYKSDVNKYGPHPNFSEGTIEECLDAAAGIFSL